MVGFIIGIAVLILSLVFRGCIILMFRFDILNSILLSGLVQMLTKDMNWSKTTRWIMFVGILILSLVLQHTHKSMKVLLGIMSTVLLMALGYGWTTYDSKLNQILAVIVCCGIGLILNFNILNNHSIDTQTN